MTENNLPNCRPLWLVFFLAMIALVGGTLGYGLSLPWLVLGRLSRSAERLGGRLTCASIRLLMWLEPWFNDDTSLSIPRGSLTVSNHRSHLDAFILLARIPAIRMVCKASLFRIPFLGLMMRAMRQIPVRRGDGVSYLEAMEEVRRGLRRGDAIHVFPEMHRCEPGAPGTQKFRLPLFSVAYQEKVPVVPIVFSGTDRVWPKGSFGLAFREPVRVRSLPPIDPRGFSSAITFAEEVQRQIDAELRAPVGTELRAV